MCDVNVFTGEQHHISSLMCNRESMLICIVLLPILSSLNDAKPWPLGGDCMWDFDRACIYVSVCINALRRGQYYCTLHLFTLSRVTVYP